MSKLKLYWWPLALSILLIFSFCSRPTEFEQSGFLYTSPEEVVANLTLAYEEKNLEGYLSSFRDDSQFYEDSEYLWGKAQEEKIHRKMFTAVRDLDLKMAELRSEEATETTRRLVYNYQLNLKLLSEQLLQGEGQVALDFVKNENGYWKIDSFRELQTSLKKWEQLESNMAKSDSANYFPLRVGNEWIYQDLINPNLPDFRVSVIDSLLIRGNLYYQAEPFGWDIFPVSASFARQDSLHQLRLFVEDDSTERVVFNLAAEIGDSLTFIPPFTTEVMIVELISHKDSLTVPAGTFKDVLEFLITDNNSGSRYLYEFAANVGVIRQRGQNQVLALKNAHVNGKIITDVEFRILSWTQIKSSF